MAWLGGLLICGPAEEMESATRNDGGRGYKTTAGADTVLPCFRGDSHVSKVLEPCKAEGICAKSIGEHLYLTACGDDRTACVRRGGRWLREGKCDSEEVPRREPRDDADDLLETEPQRRAAGERRKGGADLARRGDGLTTASLQCGARFSMGLR